MSYKYEIGDLLYDYCTGSFLLVVEEFKNTYIIFCSRDLKQKICIKENLETDHDIEKVA